jgi:hypothetical protein
MTEPNKWDIRYRSHSDPLGEVIKTFESEEEAQKYVRERQNTQIFGWLVAVPSSEKAEDWKVCFHSSGNEPGCAACWHGSFERVCKEIEQLRARVQFLIDWADKLGYLEDHCFTFPDGETWYASQEIQRL